MSEEEAIDNLKFFNEGDYITREMEESKDIVLNLIERQQREKELHIKLEQQYKKEYLDAKEEIEKYKHLYSLALNNTVKADRENLEKDKYIDKLENKLMYALSPTTHELALNTQIQFKTIIRENIEEDTYTIKRALKEYWKTFK